MSGIVTILVYCFVGCEYVSFIVNSIVEKNFCRKHRLVYTQEDYLSNSFVIFLVARKYYKLCFYFLQTIEENDSFILLLE